MIVRPLVLAALLATAQAQAAGVIDVKFVEPQKYTDAGFGSFEIGRTTEALAAHFRWLVKRLPDGQKLAVEVLDVDLAGNIRPTRHGTMRVLRGGLDMPRLKLRYTLSEGERTLAQGEDTLTEMNYLDLPARGESHNNLPYEERLLTRWFEGRFGAAQAQ